MHHSTLVATGMALLAALPCAHAGMYTKSSPVVQVDGKSYERLISKSNYTSIVEFYAPWCGHCQNLKPAYEKAAKNLEGLAKVAAVDCDDDANKPLCGSMGVKGFPTLKIVRPGKKPGRPVVEDYQGARTATAIVEAVVDKINNHVQRVTDKDLDTFLAKEGPKAILFTEKGTTSALLRSVAIDFLSVIAIGQVRNKEANAVKQFGVETFPSLVLIPGDGREPITYGGAMKKEAMVEFLSQAGEPNPDPAPAKGKTEKKAEKKAPKKEEKQEKKEKSSASKDSASQDSSTAESSPAPAAPTLAPIASLKTPEDLTKECLNVKAHTCVLALVPAAHDEAAERVLKSLGELSHKYIQGKRHLFPFFEVADDNAEAVKVKTALGLSGAVELIAVNARRSWWRHYEGDFGLESVEAWIDAIRMSEGKKEKLPEGLVVEDQPAAEPTSTAFAEPIETPIEHNEL